MSFDIKSLAIGAVAVIVGLTLAQFLSGLAGRKAGVRL